MLEIQSLYKVYGSKLVLKNITQSFERGLIHGIVGENGAGKTTLFRCLADIETYQGRIDYDLAGVRKDRTGYLTTHPFFLSRITGAEYIQLLLNARKIAIKEIAAHNIFELPLNQYAATYSTGMKKKLALTAILLQKNDLFLLDEPFNGMDIQSNILFKEVLFKLKELGKLILLSSHIFSALGETCDVLHHLKDGEIVRSVPKASFHLIETAMKNQAFQKKIEELPL